MMKSFCGCWVLLLLSSSTSLVSDRRPALTRYYKYHSNPASWEDAQQFCKRNYTDLATIYSEEDAQRFHLSPYYAWIGLQSTSFGWANILLSVGGKNNHSLFDSQNITDNPECVAVSYHNYYSQSQPLINRIYDMDCESYHYFICEDIKYFKYTFIPKAKSWSEAQQYCQDNNKDLANIDNWHLYHTVHEEDFPIWIGLHRDGGSWNWSAGHSEYKKWKSNEPSREGDCVSISSETKEMAVQNCSAYSPLLCVSDNVFLVKEEKSWEEALEYCRGLQSSTNSDLRFDLISLQPGEEHVYMRNKVMEADTEEVWTSLSFLAGEWMWVNGADLMHTDLPPCPAPLQYCGALSKHDTGRIKTRGCSQKKNFLCFRV